MDAITEEPDRLIHRENFIGAVRSRRVQDLNADILEGHLSSAYGHLANISYQLARSLEFDSYSERFIGDEQADAYLKRRYRSPYVVPDEV